MEENIIKQTKSTISNKSKVNYKQTDHQSILEKLLLCRVEETMNTNH